MKNATFETWKCSETGEKCLVFTVRKPINATKSGVKTQREEDLAGFIGIGKGKRLNIFRLILKDISPFDGTVGFTVAEMIKKASCSPAAVQEVITLMKVGGYMTKVRNSTYKMTPEFLKALKAKNVALMTLRDTKEEKEANRQMTIDDGIEDAEKPLS